MKRSALGLLAVSTGLLALSVQGCSAKTTGQLVVVVQTDLSLPKDIDAIEIDVSVDGVPKFKNSYEKLGTPDGQIHLPGTINLLAPPDPTSAVDIIVTARSGGKQGIPRILDEVVTTVPEDRAATLQVPLQFLCDGQTKFEAGQPVTSCPKGETCVAGTCVTNKVDPKNLPDFTQGSVFGDGTCFDVGRCFDAAPIVDVDPKDCSFASSSHNLNVALETQGDGICGAVGCFVALDANSKLGWTVRSDGRIQLPPAVCPKLKSGVIVHVVSAPVTAKCKEKVIALPTCGPWSNAKTQPPELSGPLALAGGQPGPASLTLQKAVDDTTVAIVWSNTGSTSDGSVKSIAPGGGTLTLVDAMSPARDVAATANDVFWTSVSAPGKGTISRAHNGGAPMPLVSGLDSPEGITLAGNSIFWTEFDSGNIFRASTSGGNKTQVATANYPYRIVSDNQYIYWTNEGTASTAPPDGSVARFDYLGGTKAETLADQQAIPRAIALELGSNGVATHVYWANFAEDGEVVRLDLSGGKPEVLAKGLKRPNGIAIDDTDVYWTNRGDGTVMKLAKNSQVGAQPTTIATDQAAPGAIAADATGVYWINAGRSDVAQGAIVKLAKGE